MYFLTLSFWICFKKDFILFPIHALCFCKIGAAQFSSKVRIIAIKLISVNWLCSWHCMYLPFVLLLLREINICRHTVYTASYPPHSYTPASCRFDVKLCSAYDDQTHCDATGKQQWPEVDCFTILSLWSPPFHSNRLLYRKAFLFEYLWGYVCDI